VFFLYTRSKGQTTRNVVADCSPKSGAALATVVGVLVEVPVMVSVVRIVLKTRGWYQRARIAQGNSPAREAMPKLHWQRMKQPIATVRAISDELGKAIAAAKGQQMRL
jgi:hypothetical protein